MEWYAQNWHELGTTVNEAAFSISLIIEESDEKVVAMDGIYAFDEEFLRDLLVAHLDLVREDVNTINANTARGNKLFLRNRVIVGMVWYTKNWRKIDFTLESAARNMARYSRGLFSFQKCRDVLEKHEADKRKKRRAKK